MWFVILFCGAAHSCTLQILSGEAPTVWFLECDIHKYFHDLIWSPEIERKQVHISNNKSILEKVPSCMGEQALCWEMMVSSSLTIAMCFSVGCVVAGVLQCLARTTPPRDYPTVLFIGLWPYSFTKSRTCTAFVWYLLRAVIPPSHYIKHNTNS